MPFPLPSPSTPRWYGVTPADVPADATTGAILNAIPFEVWDTLTPGTGVRIGQLYNAAGVMVGDVVTSTRATGYRFAVVGQASTLFVAVAGGDGTRFAAHAADLGPAHDYLVSRVDYINETVSAEALSASITLAVADISKHFEEASAAAADAISAQGTLIATMQERLIALEAGGGGTGGGGAGGGGGGTTTGPDYVTPMSSAPTIALRGDYSAPENTVAGLQRGLSAASAAWVDVRVTSDSVPVLMADSTVDRTTTGTGTVSGMTAATFTALTMETVSPEWSGVTVRPATLATAMSAARTLEKPLVAAPADGAALTATLAATTTGGTANQRTIIVAVTSDADVATVTSAGCVPARIITASSQVAAAVAAGAKYVIAPDTFSTADIQASVAAAGAVPVWVNRTGRVVTATSYRAAGAVGIVTEHPAYLNRVGGPSTRGDWRTGRLPVGVMPFRSGGTVHTPPVVSAATAGELQFLGSGAAQWAYLGNLSPIDMSTAGYLTFTVRNVAPPTAGAAQPFIAVLFGAPDDKPVNELLSTDTSQVHTNGYVVTIRPDGGSALWVTNADGTRTALLTASAGTAIATGATATFRVDWDQNADGTAAAGKLTLTRTDITSTARQVTSAAYRGGYVHAGRMQTGSQAAIVDFGVRVDVGTPATGGGGTGGGGGAGGTGSVLFLAGSSRGPYRTPSGQVTPSYNTWVTAAGQPGIWRAYNAELGWADPTTKGQSSDILARGDRVWLSMNPTMGDVTSGASNAAIDAFFEKLADLNRVSLVTPWHEWKSKDRFGVTQDNFWTGMKKIGQRLANLRAGAGGAKYNKVYFGCVQTAYAWQVNGAGLDDRVPASLTGEVSDWMDFFGIDDYPNNINQLTGWQTHPEGMITQGDKGNTNKDYFAYAKNLGLYPAIGEMGVYSEQPQGGRKYPGIGPQPGSTLTATEKDTFYKKRRADWVETFYDYCAAEGALSACYWDAIPYEALWTIELADGYPISQGSGKAASRGTTIIANHVDQPMRNALKRVFAKYPG